MLGIAVLLVLTLATTAQAASISLSRSPAPPETVLNDGAHAVSYNYTIDWEGSLTAKARQIRIWQGQPYAGGSVILSDTGQLATSNSPNPFISPTGSWTPPSGTTAGNYYVEVLFYTNQSCGAPVGSCDPDLDFEARASVQFGVSAATGNITVRKFEDLNGNGVRDGGEAGVPSWPFEVVAPNANLVGTNTYSRTTAAAGTFLLSSVPASAAGAPYSISEILPSPNPSLWAATTPTDRNVALFPGDNLVLEFGNARQTYLCGTTWHDQNGNGAVDVNEPVFPSVNVRLGGADGRGNPASGNRTTDANGRYCFGPLMPGTYRVDAETPAEYQATWDKDGSGNGNTVINPIDLTSGQPSDGNDFAFYRPTPTKVCPNGVVLGINETCPSTTKTCADGTVVGVDAACPTPPVVVPQTKLCITKKSNRKTVRQGGSVKWTVKLTNCGTSVAYDVAINDPLIADSTLVSRGKGSLVRGSLIWSVGTLQVGQSRTITFSTRFDRDASRGTHKNTARGEASNATTVNASATTKVVVVKRKPKRVAVTG